MDQIELYLSFLKWCLNPSSQESIQEVLDQMDWHSLKLFAKKQKIVGIYWHAMQKHLKLKDDIVLDWSYQKYRTA